jgi:hypothetical protein
MGKLKAWYYLKNNKKRAAVLVVSFGLYFALLYGIRFFLNPMYYTDEVVYMENADRMQSVFINMAGKLPLDESLWEEGSNASTRDQMLELNRAINEFADELEKDDRIEHIIQCDTFGIPIQTLTGTTYYYTPMVKKEDVKLICDYMGAKLIKGTYPEKAGDIIMDEKMAKNRNVRVGDTLYDDSTRVCGIVSNSGYFAVGLEYDELMVKRYLFFFDQGTITDLKQFFQEIGWEASEKMSSQIQIISDEVNSKILVDSFKAEVDQPLNVMVYAITIVMGVTLYFVYQLHVKDRYEEWCLYRSFGYSQREVFGLAFREYGICVMGSGALALGFLLIIFYLGGSMMESRGIVYRLWLPETFQQLSAIIIFLTGILQIPVFQAMQHLTTIDAIEDDI